MNTSVQGKLCVVCQKPLRAIGRQRRNGRSFCSNGGNDFSTRKTHKKCYAEYLRLSQIRTNYSQSFSQTSNNDERERCPINNLRDGRGEASRESETKEEEARDVRSTEGADAQELEEGEGDQSGEATGKEGGEGRRIRECTKEDILRGIAFEYLCA